MPHDPSRGRTTSRSARPVPVGSGGTESARPESARPEPAHIDTARSGRGRTRTDRHAGDRSPGCDLPAPDLRAPDLLAPDSLAPDLYGPDAAAVPERGASDRAESLRSMADGGPDRILTDGSPLGPAARSAREGAAGRGRLTADDPRRMGPYRLVERLGQDGLGILYLGRDEEDGEPVTVRVLRGGKAAPRRARDRLAQEAEAAMQVTGRHTARVLDADLAAERPYIVSEYAEGPSLRESVEEDGPLAAARLRKVALRTAASLAAMHKAGVVHRGFTPCRVLLGPDGAKVTGFARSLDTASAAAATAGTTAYLAPEQIEDEPVGPPADVFAWGATMVYAATGRPPFGTGTGTGTDATVLRAITSRRPDLGDLDGTLRELAARCLDKNPAARPTARQLVRALRDDQAPAPKTRPKRIPRYRWRMMIALGAVMLAGFALGVVF
ncbi:serine/threonine-protein kinase [Actinomadura sp. 9N407]|uniref:serine/threonine-protein kinase n=1 Tax=Actinomadura sp. 9N407 TaxID=3375154 RepID=UPI003794B244